MDPLVRIDRHMLPFRLVSAIEDHLVEHNLDPLVPISKAISLSSQQLGNLGLPIWNLRFES